MVVLLLFLCRFVITHLEDSHLVVMEIKIGAGPIGEMFMNNAEEVNVERKERDRRLGKVFSSVS